MMPRVGGKPTRPSPKIFSAGDFVVTQYFAIEDETVLPLSILSRAEFHKAVGK
jgi:hypothetical protein